MPEPLEAIGDVDRRWICPSCGFFQTLPASGVYLIFDRRENQVRYVGKSVDAQRRLDWWERAGNRYDDQTRFRGVQLVTTGVVPPVVWLAAPDAES